MKWVIAASTKEFTCHIEMYYIAKEERYDFRHVSESERHCGVKSENKCKYGRGPCFHRDAHLCLDYIDQLHGESENKMGSY